MRNVLKVISGIIVILCIIWYVFEPGFEPMITGFSALAGFLGTLIYPKKEKDKMILRDQYDSPEKKDLIVFIEDRPDSIIEMINFCMGEGFKTEVVSTSHSLVSTLHERKEKIALLVLDIMLFGVPNLESLNIPGSDTENGFNAGWVIVDRLLRPREKGNKPFTNIPILLISNRILRETDRDLLEDIRKRGGGKIEYLEKGSVDAKFSWHDRYKSKIQELVKYHE